MMDVSWHALITLCVTISVSSFALGASNLEKSSCGRVWVTVRSNKLRPSLFTVIRDALELNWNFTDCENIPKKIGLFKSRPMEWTYALDEYSIGEPAGYVVTKTTLGEPTLPMGWKDGVGEKGPHCLWPWVGAGDSGVDAYNCLKIQPTWMEDNADKINELQIGELAIPGTHDTGAWEFDRGNLNMYPASVVLCQDRSVWAQLVHGIRYLDFRIGYDKSYSDENDRFWLNHDWITVRPLVPLLKEIRQFLDATKEIVFLDAHNLPMGFYGSNNDIIWDAHNALLKLIERELGPHLAHANEFSTGPRTRGPTLKKLLDADKRLIFSYKDNTVVSQNEWLWPSLPHLWANTNKVDDLLSFLDYAIARSPRRNARSYLFSAMAQITPTPGDIALGRGFIRDNADKVNRIITQRLATTWRKKANIVATDFFLGNDVIDVCIAINIERGSK